MMTKLVLVALLVLLAKDGTSAVASSSSSECHKLDDPCRCEFADGKGYDLGQVVEKNYNYLETVDPGTGDHYLFHPCSDVRYMPQNSSAENECNKGDGYALCRFNNGTYVKLGTIRDSSFRSSESGLQYLVFKVNTTVTSFQLICTPDSKKSFIFMQSELQAQEATNETNLLLFSPYACPVTIEVISHSGFGKVLLILLFVGTFTYFAIGSIVRFMYLGARGIEVVPNLRFWKDLPGLVRDGARFLQNGCRVERAPDPDSYDAI